MIIHHHHEISDQ
jgi:hypothetical protein